MVTKLGTFWQHYLFRAVLSGPLLGAAALVERGRVARGRAHAVVLTQPAVLRRGKINSDSKLSWSAGHPVLTR